jgi:hypothetical protein
MWRFVIAAAVALLLSIAAVSIAIERRRKRQNLVMRDHLNKISRNWEKDLTEP